MRRLINRFAFALSMTPDFLVAHIDDDSRTRALYGRAFAEHGIGTEEFEHAAPALDALTSRQYNLILMDVGLVPGSDISDPGLVQAWQEATGGRRGGDIPAEYWRIGCHLIEWVRADDSPNKGTRIVVLSGYHPVLAESFRFARQRTLEAGADNYIYKAGRNYQDVVEEIQQLLGVPRSQ